VIAAAVVEAVARRRLAAARSSLRARAALCVVRSSVAVAEARVRGGPVRAELCGSPHGLADALLRLEQAMELVAFEASPATEPLYTTNPFAEEGLASLFISHPPLGERVRRLRELDPVWRREATRGLAAPPRG
jgi:hypothetical protein